MNPPESDFTFKRVLIESNALFALRKFSAIAFPFTGRNAPYWDISSEVHVNTELLLPLEKLVNQIKCSNTINLTETQQFGFLAQILLL